MARLGNRHFFVLFALVAVMGLSVLLLNNDGAGAKPVEEAVSYQTLVSDAVAPYEADVGAEQPVQEGSTTEDAKPGPEPELLGSESFELEGQTITLSYLKLPEGKVKQVYLNRGQREVSFMVANIYPLISKLSFADAATLAPLELELTSVRAELAPGQKLELTMPKEAVNVIFSPDSSGAEIIAGSAKAYRDKNPGAGYIVTVFFPDKNKAMTPEDEPTAYVYLYSKIGSKTETDFTAPYAYASGCSVGGNEYLHVSTEILVNEENNGAHKLASFFIRLPEVTQECKVRFLGFKYAFRSINAEKSVDLGGFTLTPMTG